jgi:hypothetical protein
MDRNDAADSRTRDAARAAGLFLDAVEGVPNRSLTTVSTPYGRADVIRDGPAADVVLHDRDATVHVRFDGEKRTDTAQN